MCLQRLRQFGTSIVAMRPLTVKLSSKRHFLVQGPLGRLPSPSDLPHDMICPDDKRVRGVKKEAPDAGGCGALTLEKRGGDGFWIACWQRRQGAKATCH